MFLQTASLDQIPELAKFKELAVQAACHEDACQRLAYAALVVWRDFDAAASFLYCLEPWLTKEIGIRSPHSAFRQVMTWRSQRHNSQSKNLLTEAYQALGITPQDNAFPPIVLEGFEAFERDLPELLKTHPEQWVIYYGKKRLKVGPTRTELLHECYAEGYRDEDLVTCYVQPAPLAILNTYSWPSFPPIHS